MKKYFLGILAIVVALGLSSFSLPKKAKTSDYWFHVTISRAIAGSQSFTNSQVSYFGNSAPSDCTGTADYCAVEFLDSQVIDNGNGNVTLNGTQTAQDKLAKN